ncbi:MAG: DUF4346 domain-containing protein [Candidatus Aenigmarchaeota archaeon]|nr:DUF4346 domain-containing protein [Candidatus Aenigmarchaeota archaeon]
MTWPLFFGENMEIGDLGSNVAICTLWTETRKIDVGKGKFAVKGNLYSGNGIKYLVRNLLANPRIRYIIMCGNDRTKSGDDLSNLFGKGIDANGRILGSDVVLDPNLTPDVIEKMRRNVELIDMRGKEDDIEERIGGLDPKPPYSKPVIIEECKEECGDLEVPDVSGLRVEEAGIGRAWLNLLDLVMKFGENKDSEHGLKQKELLNVVSVIDGDDTGIAEWLPFEKPELEKYFETFFGTGSGKGLSYTYGKRLFQYIMPGTEPKWESEARATFDQIKNAVQHLRLAPHTRRAAAFTWYVHEDSMSDSPPCLTQITWSIKHGRLFETAVFRSHDIFGGWPMNAYALRQLQRMVAKDVGKEPGALTIISNSAHIYENNFDHASRIIKEHYSGKSMELMEDRLGYFTIAVEGKQLVAKHHLPDGRETGFVFRGKDATAIFRRIVHENLVSRLDHAAYLGKELERAEQAMKDGSKYVQG